VGKYLAAPNAHLAKRDSGGVRGIPIALSVGGPIWHRNFWKKVITDHQNLAHLENKYETWAKPQKIFGRPKSGRAGEKGLVLRPHALPPRKPHYVSVIARWRMWNAWIWKM